MTSRRGFLLAAAGLALAGCGAAPDTSPPPATELPQWTPVEMPHPTAVSIPAIGAQSTLEPLGLNPDGTMAVPPVDQPAQASWYSLGIVPGATGPAVIAGHVNGQVNGQSVPGVFARLTELAVGDAVWIDRADGSRLRFSVERVESHPKDAFPTDAVYGDTPSAELRLVTCGGELGTLPDGTRSYSSNTIIFARLAELVPA